MFATYKVPVTKSPNNRSNTTTVFRHSWAVCISSRHPTS
jgi:hypothetical protein